MKVRVIVNKGGGTANGDDEEKARIAAAFAAQASKPTCD